METTRRHLLGTTFEEFAAFCAKHDLPAYRAKQVYEWVYRRGAENFEAMTNLAKPLRQALASDWDIYTSRITRRQESSDGTTKLLLEWPDAATSECVLIPDEDRRTACISSQVGCPVRCAFCASGLGGLQRQLTAGQIVEQAMRIRQLAEDPRAGDRGAGISAKEPDAQARDWGAGILPASEREALTKEFGLDADADESEPEAPARENFAESSDPNIQILRPGKRAQGSKRKGQSSLSTQHSVLSTESSALSTQNSALSNRLSNIVLMGLGEPLANYANVLAAIRIINAEWGMNIGARKITLSTVGLPPQIRKLAKEDLQINLALSLHAPNDELRRRLIPWAAKIPIADLVASVREYFDRTGREITVEYILLAGVNDQPEHAYELGSLCHKMRCNVNLIRYNPVAGLGYQRPTSYASQRFQARLRERGVNAHLRKSRGADIDAACGQLRRRELANPASS